MADEPLTNNDLYGPSSPSSPLPIEETPEIPMELPPVPPPQPAPPPTPPPPTPIVTSRNKPSFFQVLGMLILLVGLFGVGIWLSTVVRQYLPGNSAVVPTPTAAIVTPTPSASPAAAWKTYQVVSGVTKQPIVGISFQLPSEVLAPICDTIACGSQGTYLPGGTRFTVAPRGAGQVLSDFRGNVISDAGGIVFTVREATLSGIIGAKEFGGIFNGKTVTGYAFSQMRGYMIPVTSSLSLEINHFTPTGITTNWTADDALFDKIVETVSVSSPAAMQK